MVNVGLNQRIRAESGRIKENGYFDCFPLAVNGRYKNVSHVAIYAGNGMVIDASSSKGCVVYRALYSEDQIILCARPRK